jgi:hypothetical protein
MPQRVQITLGIVIAAAIVVVVVLVASGGDSSRDSSSGVASRPASPESDFPAVDGRSLEQVYSDGTPDNKLVAAPSGQVFGVGDDRFGFGLFTADGNQLTSSDVAIYAGQKNGPAIGPFPARIESMETEPSFRAKTTSDDPDSAKAVYVTDLPLDKPGEWRMFAMVKEGNDLHTTILPSLVASNSSKIPDVGQKAPVVHTPTASDVANLSEIDTRLPHDTMHDVDLADVLGKKPVVLVFATPALCQSRVCGPVVDVEEQVKSEFSDSDVAFIHQEVYEDNNPNKGYRSQLKTYGLRTEPWLFVIDRNGTISTRIEGAFGASELERAVRKVEG